MFIYVYTLYIYIYIYTIALYIYIYIISYSQDPPAEPRGVVGRAGQPVHIKVN